ncbi:MAG: ribonuclease P/MRP protein subunit POP5 [Halobacteriales archaeon]|jgi:ribonuclease P/MRP protein subunit POP5
MKHLPKHLRPRWRYLAVELETWPDVTIDRGSFQRAVWYAAQNLLGDPGSADADGTVIRFEYADGVGEAILRVRHGEVEPARAALACVSDVNGDPVRIAVQGVSGTIRACEEKYLNGPPEIRAEKSVAFEGRERSAVLRADAADVRIEDGFAGATELDLE